jgi:hypothetical protein
MALLGLVPRHDVVEVGDPGGFHFFSSSISLSSPASLGRWPAGPEGSCAFIDIA